MTVSRRPRRLAARFLAGAAVALGLGAQTAPAPARAPQATPAAPAPAAQRPPNVVLILADDMGFSDISSYGSEIPTPNIDALAAGGLRFTQFYNAARCSPSRASLLTGLYPHEAGLGHLEAEVQPESRGTQGKLLDRAVTIAEVLRTRGYFTGMAGKWHLGITHGVGPWQRGFDRSIASPEGGLYFPDQTNPATGRRPALFIDGKRVASDAPEVGKGNWYGADLFVDWDTKFMNEAKGQGKPFFLYLPFVSVHFPLMAPPEDIARFKGRYMAGWEAMRRDRLARMQKLGIVPATETLPAPLPVAYDWSKLSREDRERFDTIMAIYAADVARMDKAVGTLVARLKAAGEFDNTLILFLSDNGGNAESGPDGRLQGKGAPGSAGSRVFAGLNWATLQNTPFQYFKHFTEEGGISTPLIAHWPAGIDRRLNGTLVRDPGHLVDVMPTIAQATGATYPTSYNGHAILPAEGRSFLPAFHGQPLARATPIFWAHEGNQAVRDGRWKLVARNGEPWRLYDMTADRGETRDAAAANPALVARMSAQWDAWAARSFVDPWTRKETGGVFPGRLAGGRDAGGADAD